MENLLVGLVVALVTFIAGKISSDLNSSKKYDELKKAFDEDKKLIEDRHSKDKEMWAGMFKILGEKLDALNDSINQNNLISAGKVSVDKFDSCIAKIYGAMDEFRDKLNNCMGCKNYEKRG